MTLQPDPFGLALVEESEGQEAPPESLLISSLLESGQYNPHAYAVKAEAVRAHKVVHQWCLDYQDHAGEAPPVHLVTSKFPAFVYVPSVSPAWAAHEVQKAEANRILRKALAKAAAATRDEAHGEAAEILRTAVNSISSASRPGTLVTDFRPLRVDAERNKVHVPGDVLRGLTGGHPAGQLWLLAGIWGSGKTFDLLNHAVAAVESGWDATVFSMEMSTEEILERLHLIALRGIPGAPAMDLDARERLVAQWAEGTGTLEIRSPMDGRVDASVIAGAVDKGARHLVVVDYVGKMHTLSGTYAGQDHEAQKIVSNELKRVAAEMGVPILAAAQLNRMGQLAGSIALEQDADLIMESAQVGQCFGIRKKRLVKTRHTRQISDWYSRFDPMRGDFSDVTHAEAYRLRMEEESALL